MKEKTTARGLMDDNSAFGGNRDLKRVFGVEGEGKFGRILECCFG
jgi:hypothetical protein